MRRIMPIRLLILNDYFYAASVDMAQKYGHKCTKRTAHRPKLFKQISVCSSG
jgi:hypothetical protein